MALRFKKAEPEQGFLKICFYGPPGSGKTATALLVAEWLAKKDNKRIAFLDTEHGEDFYGRDIPERKFHPKAFDYDRMRTRSIMDARDALINLEPEYGVVVYDSVTHLWNSAMELYTGKKTSTGSFPIQAWQVIKKPWHKMIQAGLDGKFHFILNARQGWVFGKDEDGEFKSGGTRPKAEPDTGYEPHVTCRMFQERDSEREEFKIKAFIEKDRSGILMGKTITWPSGDTFASLYNYLTPTHTALPDSDAVTETDIARVQEEVESQEQDRKQLYTYIKTAILESKTIDALRVAWDLSKGKKKKLGEDFWGELEALKDTQKVELSVADVASL